MTQGERVYTLRDFRGYPTSVPESKLDAWLAQQAELEKNPPPEEPPVKLTEETMAQLTQIFERLAANGLQTGEPESFED